MPERVADGVIVKTGKHRCSPPHPLSYAHGTVWQCGCGRRWVDKQPGNPDYAHWRRRLFDFGWRKRVGEERAMSGLDDGVAETEVLRRALQDLADEYDRLADRAKAAHVAVLEGPYIAARQALGQTIDGTSRHV